MRTTWTWPISLSKPHPDRPFSEPGVKLGDEQFALAAEWESRGQLALVRHGHGSRPDRCLRRPRREARLRRGPRGPRPRRRRPRDPRVRLRAGVQHLDDDRGVPQPADRLGGRRLAHDRAVQRAGVVPVPGGHRPGRVRQRRARGGPARPALARDAARRPSSTRSAPTSSTSSRRSTRSAWTAPTRSA